MSTESGPLNFEAAVAPASTPPMQPAVSILICALGGEGGGVLAEWLYGAAVRAGLAAQATSIPGVAQRTGATTYYVEVAPQPLPAGAPRPVFSLSPVPGCVDLLVASELLEAVRQAAAGFVSAERTVVLASSSRTLTTSEKMQLGDGRASDDTLRQTIAAHSRRFQMIDFVALAREAGTVVSAPLLGAMAASGVLPLRREACEAQIRASGKGVAASLRGFVLGFDAVRTQAAAAPAQPAPATLADLTPLARQRVATWQGERYAQAFDARLQRLRSAGATPELLAEAARWLALWMAYDDVIRVAELKLAASRLDRVRREVRAGEGDVLKVFDHFKPGVPELAGLLPPRWAMRLQAWERRRVAAGRNPLALPLRLGTHTVLGMLALRVLAAAKVLRPRGARFIAEQGHIDAWLGAVERALREPAAAAELALEIVRSGRLIKGYGATFERGQRNLLHIVNHLALADRPAHDRAAAVRAAREAALTDEAGTALDQTLAAHGAPPRPLREQVVRLHRRRPAG